MKEKSCHTKVRILFIIACGEELEAIEDLPGVLVWMEEILRHPNGLGWCGLGLRVCLEGHGDLVRRLITAENINLRKVCSFGSEPA